MLNSLAEVERFLNENFPQPVVVELRRLGHDVLTVQETGRADQAWPDKQVLAFATADGRSVLTFNRRHFVRLHATDADHAGIVVCSVDTDSGGLAARIHDAVLPYDALDGQLLRVNRPASRQ